MLREFPLLASYGAGASPKTASTAFAFAAPTINKNYGDGRMPKIVASVVNIYTALVVPNYSKATLAMSPTECPCFHVGAATNFSCARVANLEQYPKAIVKYVEITCPSLETDLRMYSRVCSHRILADPCLLYCDTSTNDVTFPWLNFLQSPRAILPIYLVLQCDIQNGVPSLKQHVVKNTSMASSASCFTIAQVHEALAMNNALSICDVNAINIGPCTPKECQGLHIGLLYAIFLWYIVWLSHKATPKSCYQPAYLCKEYISAPRLYGHSHCVSTPRILEDVSLRNTSTFEL